MSSKEKPFGLDELRYQEVPEIEKRRTEADITKLSPEEVSQDLSGVALSGGGLRSASFSLGIVQALHRTGLWRFVDYLSTVSGGGFTGAYLSSSLIQGDQKFDQENFPLKEEAGDQQSPEVQRLIYGGHFLNQPWLLFNKWLIGVVLINLSLFSGMFCVCALVAYLWRCLDYGPVREVAVLLGFGTDLDAPFWPFIAFAIGWFLVWLISFWRRSANSMGLPARFLLYLTVPSLLIGCALLVGNGDVAGFSSAIGGGTFSIGTEVWAPIVGLIFGGLFPFLRPKRLLQSGINPSKPWERALFMVASASLLIGLPLVFVGMMARENISGFNDHRYRPLILGDVNGWPEMMAIIFPHENEQFQKSQSSVDVFRNALARMPYDAEEPFQPTDDQIDQIAKKSVDVTTSEELKRHLLDSKKQGEIIDSINQGKFLDPEKQISAKAKKSLIENQKESIEKLGRKVRRLNALEELSKNLKSESEQESRIENAVNAMMESSSPWFALNFNKFLSQYEEQEERKEKSKILEKSIRQYLDYFSTPKLPITEHSKDVPLQVRHLHKFLDAYAPQLIKQDPWVFLYLRTFELSQGTKYFEEKKIEIFHEDEYSSSQNIADYLIRVYHVGGWLIWNQDNQIREYWDSRKRQFLLQTQICDVLNAHVLRDQVLLDEQLELQTEKKPDVKEDSSSSVNTNTSDSKGATDKVEVKEEKSNYDKERNSLAKIALQIGPEQLQEHKVRQLNRMLLEQNLPGVLRERSEIRRVVSIEEDQKARLKYFFISLVVFLATLSIDMNGLSLHNYYRNRLVQGFIKYKSGKKNSIPLSELKTTDYGGPYHLISGTVSFPFRKLNQSNKKNFELHDKKLTNNKSSSAKTSKDKSNEGGQDRDEIAVKPKDQRWVDSFLFSRHFCGSQITGYKKTEKYEDSVQGENTKIDLADAIAISGAAIAPGHVRNWLAAFLMLIFNFRLGQWLPNPKQKPPKTKPRVFALLWDFLKKPVNRDYCFVTDGGMSDNLGLVQLLKRRCKLIISVDAGYDPNHAFDDLGKAIRISRIHGGVKFVSLEKNEDGHETEILPTSLQLSPSKNVDSSAKYDKSVESHFLFAKICYADGSEGLLIYLKPSFDNDESIDLLNYRAKHNEFPHETSADQFYDDAQVESYRKLGHHIGMQLYKKIENNITENDLWNQKELTVQQICKWFTQSESPATPDVENINSDKPSEKSGFNYDTSKSDRKALAIEVLARLREQVSDPAKLESFYFRQVLEELVIIDKEDEIVGIIEEFQKAIIDREKKWSIEDRLYIIYLLVQIEKDQVHSTDPEKTFKELYDFLLGSVDSLKLHMVAIGAVYTIAEQTDMLDQAKKLLDKVIRQNPSEEIQEYAKNALGKLSVHN